ncbi:hypothetical protein L798_13377 [Zootermopsis nevadensis]|uniref:Uncharacterized protein n=1 Tax=Zootermopsis nevadensis TaxID=136037 RepID=A0A067QRF5_ZOONE|nr:hypothetical protein L798_13377 [Zootermopsis nevadensis]
MTQQKIKPRNFNNPQLCLTSGGCLPHKNTEILASMFRTTIPYPWKQDVFSEVVAEIDVPYIMLKKMLERRRYVRSRIFTEYIRLHAIWKVCLLPKNVTRSKIYLIHVRNI